MKKVTVVLILGVITMAQLLFIYRAEYQDTIKMYVLASFSRFTSETPVVTPAPGYYCSPLLNWKLENTCTIDACENGSSSSGVVQVKLDYPELEEVEKLNPDLSFGGHYEPENCTPRAEVAIVVPFRDREQHLKAFLHNLHPFLKRQKLRYTIYIIEQVQNQTFNRGKLMNVGFLEAIKDGNWSCFIFHDVDLLPENDRNIYACTDQPRHVSVAINKFGYKLVGYALFAGINAFTDEQYRQVNGFSNDFWGWGGEDDEVLERIKYINRSVFRLPENIARYRMIKHERDKMNPVNPCRHSLLAKSKFRFRRDGLNNVDYRVVSIEKRRLFTRVLVDLFQDASIDRLINEGACPGSSANTRQGKRDVSAATSSLKTTKSESTPTVAVNATKP